MWLGDYVITTTWFLTTLGTFFWLLLFLTLAPRDYVTYYQAWGLSGHTSPCGECDCSHLETTSEDWLHARLVFYFMTLTPRDYATYYQARGLSGHTSPCGECAFWGYAQGLAACSAGLLFFLLWTLAPHDYVIYYQTRGLSGHTSPRSECACFFLEDSVPLEAEED